MTGGQTDYFAGRIKQENLPEHLQNPIPLPEDRDPREIIEIRALCSKMGRALHVTNWDDALEKEIFGA